MSIAPGSAIAAKVDHTDNGNSRYQYEWHALRTIADTVNSGLVLLDRNGCCTFMNAAAQQATGFTFAEIYGQPIHGKLHAHSLVIDSIEPPCPIRNAFRQTSAVRDIEDTFLKRDGSPFPVRCSVTPLVAEGTLFGVLIEFRETTEEKRAADALHCAKEALRESDKLAAMGRLAATIAHEINNPLEALTNLIFLLKDVPNLHEEARSYVELAEEELIRVARITKQSLAFHRESSEPIPVSLTDVLHEILDFYSRQISSRRIALRREIEPGLSIHAFPGEMRQVFSNLIGNALEAMKTGGMLCVRARRCSDGVRVIVLDSGSGICEADRRKIFEPFFTTKQQQGTGLGLWVTAEVIRKHHGSIHVRSTLNPAHPGTCFSIFLPFWGESTQTQPAGEHRAISFSAAG